MAATADFSIRLRRRLRALNDSARYRLGLPPPAAGQVRISPRFRHTVDADRRASLVARYRQHFPEAAVAELSEARRLAAHEFNLLGHAMKHGTSIAWSRDPVSGRDWSEGFSTGISYRGPTRLGDIKLPWELAKHQYFFTLGKAAWLSGDKSLSLEILRQIDHWIAANPPGRGIHWASALESGTRAVSWILAFPFYSEFCDAESSSRLTRSLGQHLLFVEHHLSLGRFANTHLVGEAASLVIGGLFLECRHSARWLIKGVGLLEQEMQRQSTPDGVHVERSAAYQRFFLDQYYLTDAFLRANGQRFSTATVESMERMTEFLMDMLLPDGSAMSFGDGDDARGLWMRADCPGEYRSLLSLGAVLFGRGDFKRLSKGPAEELLWLKGETGLHEFEALPEKAPSHDSVSYAEGGYSVMRGGWDTSDPVFAFDCGPLGHGPAGHGHADALSFQLHAGGYPFLVDPGTYSYNIDYQWRDAFRSTRAHNTVVVDGQDQSVAVDRMAWRDMANATRNRWITTSWFDLLDGSHDGYRRLADPVAHRRIAMFVRPDVWLIWDILQGHAPHRLEASMHVRPDCSVDSMAKSDGVVLRSPDGALLHVRVTRDSGMPLQPEIVNGSEDVREAWYSPVYGVRMPARVLRYEAEWSGRYKSMTGLYTSVDVEAVLVKHEGAVCARILRAGRHESTIFYRLLADGLFRIPDMRFDGEFLFRLEAGQKSAVVWASDFRELEIDNLLKVRSRVKVESLILKDHLCTIILGSGNPGDVDVETSGGLRVTFESSDFR